MRMFRGSLGVAMSAVRRQLEGGGPPPKCESCSKVLNRSEGRLCQRCRKLMAAGGDVSKLKREAGPPTITPARRAALERQRRIVNNATG
jgi:hypothetical protein